MPASAGYPIADEDKEKIMHISLPISKETILMGSDTSAAFGKLPVVGENYSISVSTNTEEETTRIFNELSAGGKIKMPLEKTFWGSYFAMFIDKFGIHWMVSSEHKK